MVLIEFVKSPQYFIQSLRRIGRSNAPLFEFEYAIGSENPQIAHIDLYLIQIGGGPYLVLGKLFVNGLILRETILQAKLPPHQVLAHGIRGAGIHEKAVLSSNS